MNLPVRVPVRLLFALALTIFLWPAYSRADVYVGSDFGSHFTVFQGFTSGGFQYLEYQTGGVCGLNEYGNDLPCLETLDFGTTYPGFVAKSCGPLPSQLTTFYAGCSDGSYVFYRSIVNGSFTNQLGVYVGSDINNLQFFGTVGSFYGPVEVNSQNGDIYFYDQTYNVINYAADVNSRVTPEPSTVALLGTGMLGLFGAVRRRVWLR